MPAPKPHHVPPQYPKFPHSSDEWTWHSFTTLRAKGDNVCIFLKTLCVIEVATEEQALALEARFPILLEAPAEATKRGRHYFFRRTPEADAEGFVDGAGQHEEGIDFNTITAEGTSGIILVAPSTDSAWLTKSWARAFDDAPAPPIPRSLLEAVALPWHVTRDVLLTFPDGGGELLLHGAHNLHAFGCFEPHLGAGAEGAVGAAGRDGGEAITPPLRLPVPVQRSLFEELWHLLEMDCFGVEPTFESVIALEGAVDMCRMRQSVRWRVINTLRRQGNFKRGGGDSDEGESESED